MEKGRKRRWIRGTVLLLLLALAGAGAWAADYFLFPKVVRSGIPAPADYRSQEEDLPASGNYPILLDAFPAEAVDLPVEAGTDSTDGGEGTFLVGASDDGINRIVVTKTVEGSGDSRVTYYVADILTSDARELKTCFAQDAYGENIYEWTSHMAQRSQAVLAVNGDCYGWRDDGIVIRNGELFRDAPARTGLALYRDGQMECYDERQTDGKSLVDSQVWLTLSFGPELVRDGQAMEDLDASYRVDLTDIQHRQPRTAVGQVDANHFVLVVVDGRQSGYSEGIRLNDLAALMESLGCRTAYNLDGGASSTMYFKGRIVNHPSASGGERKVSDCLYIN